MIFKVLSMVPLRDWLWAAAIAFLLGWHFENVHKHVAACDARWHDELTVQKAGYDKQIAAIKEVQQQVIYRTVIEYRDRVQIVKEKGDEIVREVEKLVPRTVGELPGGMRVVHDAAASGVLPDDPERAADSAAPVEASTLAATVAANYETCRANAEELVALQSLVTSLKGASP